MALKLYGIVPTINTMGALACLFEKDLDVEFVKLGYDESERQTPEFLARNPFGDIPVLEDGDITLFESRAITQYLARTYADKGTDLMMKDPLQLAIQTMWMEVESHKFQLPAHNVVMELYVNGLRLGQKGNESVVKENEAKLADLFDVYESRLKESKYLGGDKFTLADLHHLPGVHYLMATDAKKLFEARPHVAAWAADILARPAWQKAVSILRSNGWF